MEFLQESYDCGYNSHKDYAHKNLSPSPKGDTVNNGTLKGNDALKFTVISSELANGSN